MTGGVTNSIAASSVASSSSVSSAVSWKYDVFLSFRGPDTRKGITFELYERLHNKRGITTFMDDRDLEVGDAISPALLKAIEESRFAIIVLSPNYASSTWCLEELAKICECMKENNRILPLFYNVEPSDVRYRKRSFKEAFNDHESSGRHTSEKVQRWKDALNKVANFCGWDIKNFKTERELVDTIVQEMCTKVPLEMEFTMSAGDFQEFEATRKTRNEVMEALADDEVTAVGVCGMGGVGKTTMVKHVAAQSCKKGTFHHVIMAVVSQIPNFKNIQETLLQELLGSDVQLQENSTESGRASRLCKEILKKNNILIILDDIWKFTDLSRIGIPNYNKLKKCNSKVLLTTRIWNVCHVMECQRKITLHILSKEDSWTLFVSKARRTFESTTFEAVARRVAGECKGLPIALIAVARALGDKDLAEWEKAAQRLGQSQSANPDHEEDTFECIKLSYDYLKNEEYKSFFLLCCLFPEDCPIEREELFRYAIGKGLFRDAETIYEARGKADTVLKHLMYSCFFLEDEDLAESVKVHDVVRDTALNIAKSEEGHRFLVKAGSGSDDWLRQLHEDCTAISLMKNNILELPPQMVCAKLQILSLNENYVLQEIPESFFQNLNELRVLDLSWTNISSLSQSFGHLTNLRALCLDSCKSLNDISMVGKLTKLEVLSMRRIKLVELSREIGNLTNLRVLDISRGKIDRIPSKLISRLQNLEELYLECEFWEWGSKVDEEGDETNAGFDEVTGLSRLKVLKVLIGDPECIPKLVELNPNWVKFDMCIGKGEELPWTDSSVYGDTERIITLKLDSFSNFPDWFLDAVMNKAEILHWAGCPWTRLNDVFVEYERGRLHELKNLIVSGSYNITTEVPNEQIPSEPVFESLEKLTLRDIEFLSARFLPSLCNLKFLEVECCRCRGTVLLPSKLLQGLPILEELLCNRMEDIKYVFGCEALLETEQSKLRKIELSHLYSLRSICAGPAPTAMFQNLQSLSIKRCRLQGSLFTADVAQNLDQLRYLDLYNCRFLERIVEASNKKINFQKLKDLRLTNLPRLDYKSTTIDFECPSLEDLYLRDCPKFLVSVSNFHSHSQVQLYDDFKFSWESFWKWTEMLDRELEEPDLSDQESEEQDSEYESEEQDLSDQESEEQDSDKPDESGEGEVSVSGG